MRKLLTLAMLLWVPASVHAQPALVAVDLVSFNFAPSTVQLKSGVRTSLRLHNRSNGGHNFSAPTFFAAAKVDPKSAALIRKGSVEVPAGGIVELELVPAAGTYPLKCTHMLHSTFGMKGTINVR